VIAGDGAARPELERLARDLKVAERIRFAGWVSDEERTREYERADVFCLPSAQEGFGIVFLEAMAAGRPSVGAAAGAIPEVLAPAAGELFPYDDEAALARAVLKASARFDSGDLTPESIRAFYESRYSWARFRDAWTKQIAELR